MLFFAGDIGDTDECDTRPDVKYLMREMKGFERVCKLLLESKPKALLANQSVKLKFQIWFEITKKFASKCLDAAIPVVPSLCLFEYFSVSLCHISIFTRVMCYE